MSANKDFRPIVDALRAQGWELTQTERGHWRAAPPDKTKPLVHFAESNEVRALKNCISQLRQSGFVWPPPEDRERLSQVNIELGGRVIGSTLLLEDDAPDPTPAELTEAHLDDLWEELKEARGYYALAQQHVAECDAELRAAQMKHQKALDEQLEASKRFGKAKTELASAVDKSAA
jgi:hypothetical protein